LLLALLLAGNAIVSRGRFRDVVHRFAQSRTTALTNLPPYSWPSRDQRWAVHANADNAAGEVTPTRPLRNLVLLVLAGAFLLGVWSTHRPPAFKPKTPSGPAFRTVAESGSHGGTRPARLVGIQTSRQDGFDRVEFTFDQRMPSWRVGYASAIRDAAGRRVPVQGAAALSVTFQPAQVRDADGGSSFGPESRSPNFGAVRQVRLAGDVEGNVRFGVGLAARGGFRVLEASTPPCVIIDVRTS
jgi:hypothetical protein